jgi:hypothetical protein
MDIGRSISWDKYLSKNARWSRHTAPMVLSILLDLLKRKAGPISYDDLANELLLRYGEPVQYSKQKYGWPLGGAADSAIDIGLQHGMEIPPLSLIVINRSTGLPGKGADQFVRRLKGKKLPIRSPKRRAILDEETARVWGYGTKRWTELERLLGLDPLPAPANDKADLGLPPKHGNCGAGEGPLHKALKIWVSRNPQKFREFGHFDRGENEATLISGDSVDAMLYGANTRLGVEVKASNASDDELIRGIFQCVKYQATFQAEAAAYPGIYLPGRCILVSTRKLPRRVRATADLLGVRCLRVNKHHERPTERRRKAAKP